MKTVLLSFALAFAPLTLATQTSAQTLAAPAHQDHDASMPVKPPVPPSRSVSVTLEGHVTNFTVEDLLKLPQTTVHVHNAHRNAEETYSGPLLADVLAQAGLKASRETEPLMLHSSLVATAPDHYFVLYSIAEVEPTFSTGQVIVSVMKSGLPDTEGGLIQLINTTDARPARWLHGLSNLNVMSVAQNK